MNDLVIIDGNSLINRAFYALPLLSNKEGVYSNAVFGFCNMLIKVIVEDKPSFICVAFDYGKHTFRNDMYSDYKAGRKSMPDELRSQLPLLKEILSYMNIKIIEKEGIEADDIIGTLSKRFPEKTIILTGDRDSLQLIDDSTEVWLTKKGLSNVDIMNRETLFDTYKITPSQVIDIKSLMGDASDNIPGVEGVGEVTAVKLLDKYKTLDGVYENIDKINGSLKDKLIKDKDKAYLSYKLATIVTNCDIDCKIDNCVYDFPFNDKVYEFFKKYDFNSLIKRKELFLNNNIKDNTEINNLNKNVEIKEIKNSEILENIIKEIKIKNQFGFYFDNLAYLSIDGESEYKIFIKNTVLDVGIDKIEFFNLIKEVFEDKNIKKVLFDYKKVLHLLDDYKIGINGEVFDCLIPLYIFNASDKYLSIDSLCERYNLDSKCYASSLINSENTLKNQLKDEKVLDLYNKIDFPLEKVLFSMEQNGVKIDTNRLNELDKIYSGELEKVVNEIKNMNQGQDINLNSPKQLSTFLFDTLKLVPPDSKSRSTDIDTLIKLQNDNEIVKLIIQYRKLQKIKTTYIDVFKSLTKDTDFIYCSFNQTTTSTGRLSSTEPNLQNIPARDEEGKDIRELFISRFNDGIIVDADYSQIELRLMAQYSRDVNLINDFNTGKDIHTSTASKIFNVDLKDVTKDMRSDAKAVNFGIIYGIGAYGLAKNINKSIKDATAFMKTYFERYKSVKEYMKKAVEDACKNNRAYTMYGRFRNIPELSSTNKNIRAFGERVSMNMPLQGTASDIIKIAMINVYNDLIKNNLKSKLIIQVHDELVIDCEKSELEKVKKLLQDDMENVCKLVVPLKVELNYGKNWYDAK